MCWCVFDVKDVSNVASEAGFIVVHESRQVADVRSVAIYANVSSLSSLGKNGGFVVCFGWGSRRVAVGPGARGLGKELCRQHC